jgi:hypothetical protein
MGYPTHLRARLVHDAEHHGGDAVVVVAMTEVGE